MAEHSHDHHHHHTIDPSKVNTAFIIGIVLNMIFVLVEAVAGFWQHSLSLLSDAGHNLADVGSLALSLLAFRLVKVKSTPRYTYGFRKTSVLVALFNAIVLLLSLAWIAYEGVQRLWHPQEVSGINISIIAGIGIVINFLSARLFSGDKDHDMNVKSAYLHLMADAVISLGIVIGGILIYFTKAYWIDPAISVIIAIVILFSTWSLLKESIRLSLDAVPENINLEEIKATALRIPGITRIEHVHVWAMSTTENAMTAILYLRADISAADEADVKKKYKHELEHLNIQHSTLETSR